MFLLITSLSGAFSLVLTPVIAAQLILLRDFTQRRMVYLIVPTCGSIECLFIFASHRLSGLDTNVGDWTHAFVVFFSFGAESAVVFVASGLFWIITAGALVRWTSSRHTLASREEWMFPVFPCLAAACVFLSGALAMGPLLPTLSPLDMSSRYFLIPYSLLFLAAFVCTKDKKWAQAILVVLLSIIFIAEFRTVDRPDRASSTGWLIHGNMQWTAFTKFHDIKPDLTIPINSPLPAYPPMDFVKITKRNPSVSPADSTGLELLYVRPTTGREAHATATAGAEFAFHAADATSAVYFDISRACVGQPYLGVEIRVWRSRMGEAMISWEPMKTYPIRDNSLKRFYPEGDVTMQFAFRRNLDDSVITFQPALGLEDSAFLSLVRRYQDFFNKAGISVGRPTESGGDVNIRGVRLFCLH
jgi:hypothetical protein